MDSFKSPLDSVAENARAHLRQQRHGLDKSSIKRPDRLNDSTVRKTPPRLSNIIPYWSSNNMRINHEGNGDGPKPPRKSQLRDGLPVKPPAQKYGNQRLLTPEPQKRQPSTYSSRSASSRGTKLGSSRESVWEDAPCTPSPESTSPTPIDEDDTKSTRSQPRKLPETIVESPSRHDDQFQTSDVWLKPADPRPRSSVYSRRTTAQTLHSPPIVLGDDKKLPPLPAIPPGLNTKPVPMGAHGVPRTQVQRVQKEDAVPSRAQAPHCQPSGRSSSPHASAACTGALSPGKARQFERAIPPTAEIKPPVPLKLQQTYAMSHSKNASNSSSHSKQSSHSRTANDAMTGDPGLRQAKRSSDDRIGTEVNNSGEGEMSRIVTERKHMSRGWWDALGDPFNPETSSDEREQKDGGVKNIEGKQFRKEKAPVHSNAVTEQRPGTSSTTGSKGAPGLFRDFSGDYTAENAVVRQAHAVTMAPVTRGLAAEYYEGHPLAQGAGQFQRAKEQGQHAQVVKHYDVGGKAEGSTDASPASHNNARVDLFNLQNPPMKSPTSYPPLHVRRGRAPPAKLYIARSSKGSTNKRENNGKTRGKQVPRNNVNININANFYGNTQQNDPSQQRESTVSTVTQFNDAIPNPIVNTLHPAAEQQAVPPVPVQYREARNKGRPSEQPQHETARLLPEATEPAGQVPIAAKGKSHEPIAVAGAPALSIGSPQHANDAQEQRGQEQRSAPDKTRHNLPPYSPTDPRFDAGGGGGHAALGALASQAGPSHDTGHSTGLLAPPSTQHDDSSRPDSVDIFNGAAAGDRDGKPDEPNRQTMWPAEDVDVHPAVSNIPNVQPNKADPAQRERMAQPYQGQGNMQQGSNKVVPGDTQQFVQPVMRNESVRSHGKYRPSQDTLRSDSGNAQHMRVAGDSLETYQVDSPPNTRAGDSIQEDYSRSASFQSAQTDSKMTAASGTSYVGSDTENQRSISKPGRSCGCCGCLGKNASKKKRRW
ncbi:hypothetical protein KEM55_007779, partial [Ascosphaera atra]